MSSNDAFSVAFKMVPVSAVVFFFFSEQVLAALRPVALGPAARQYLTILVYAWCMYIRSILCGVMHCTAAGARGASDSTVCTHVHGWW